MIKVLFVCHGNICRSPMAEFLFKDYVNKKGTANKFHIESRATSSEEIGNPVHYGTAKILKRLNIDYRGKRAERISEEDYNNYDFIIIMEEYNRYNIERRIPDRDRKIHTLLEYTDLKRDISDPWYTGDFEGTYNDITIGLDGFYSYLKNNGLI
ncbi:MAG: low molecular weight phosphotyrosine protein phosphatase [Acholeplasmatales bacterium]|nr:low molecular weight phosphotyrosine protein phosphatase [Acholeplasmatales bacterium]